MYNYYKLGETTFLAAFYLVFGLYFFEFTLHQDKYIDEGCVALKYWAHLYSIFAQIGAALWLSIGLPYTYILVSKKLQYVTYGWQFYFQLLYYLTYFTLIGGSIFFAVMITLKYWMNEPCYQLRELTTIYLLCYWSIALLGVIILVYAVIKSCMDKRKRQRPSFSSLSDSLNDDQGFEMRQEK